MNLRGFQWMTLQTTREEMPDNRPRLGKSPMRKRRLQHNADTLCQMFCGWRLIKCKPQLVALGSGTIHIDVLSGSCSFEGKTIPQLSIAEELRLWLLEDLEANHIPVAGLTGASLETKLSFSEIPWPDRIPHDKFFNDGRTARTDKVHRCAIRCCSEVATDEAVYRSDCHDIQEWPVGWPAA